MSKELDYIVKRKNKIGKKLDKDQSLLEEGKLYSSDKQWFGWCEEYETLQSIEKALKDYEIITKPREIIGTTTIDKALKQFLIDSCPDIAKKQKALQIIKEERANVEYIKVCENYEQYRTICSYWNEITIDEFYLLREVLL